MGRREKRYGYRRRKMGTSCWEEEEEDASGEDEEQDDAVEVDQEG